MTLKSPAKINLFLGVLGPREDSFHELLSVVAPLSFGDTLTLTPLKNGPSRITCDWVRVPLDAQNLCLKALTLFEETTGRTPGPLHIDIDKNVPPGSGLGGGSSNAASLLMWLNKNTSHPLTPAELHTLALRLGSDVPLFLNKGPQLLQGRGETLSPLDPHWSQQLQKRPVLIFLPGLHVSTSQAFKTLKESQSYMPAQEASARLQACLDAHLNAALLPPEGLQAFNSFQKTVFAQHPELQHLDTWAQKTLGRPLQLSGSGSACFIVGLDLCPPPPIGTVVRARFL